MSAINLQKVKRETLSAKRFLGLSETDMRKVKSVSIAPPQLGALGFGGVVVEYYSPKWVQASGEGAAKLSRRVRLANGRLVSEDERA